MSEKQDKKAYPLRIIADVLTAAQRRADDDEGRKGARFNVFVRYIGGQS